MSDRRLYTIAVVCIAAGLVFFAGFGVAFERTTGEPLCDPVLTLEECTQ